MLPKADATSLRHVVCKQLLGTPGETPPPNSPRLPPMSFGVSFGAIVGRVPGMNFEETLGRLGSAPGRKNCGENFSSFGGKFRQEFLQGVRGGLASHFGLCSNEFLGKTSPEQPSLAKPYAPPRGLLTYQALPAIQTFKYQRLPLLPNTGHMPQ